MPKSNEKDETGSPNLGPDGDIRFLLPEYESLRQFREQNVAIADKRVDVLLALSSGLIAVLGLLFQNFTSVRDFIIVAIVGLSWLLVIGITTLKQVIERDIVIVDLIRSLNKIRAYFGDRAPHIQSHLLMPATQNFPRYDWQFSNIPIPIFINGLTVAGLFLGCRLWFGGISLADEISFWLGITTFVVVCCLQALYANIVFVRARKKASISGTVSLYESRKPIGQQKMRVDNQDSPL